MKKFLVLLLALVMVLSVVGCSSSTDAPAAEAEKEVEKTEEMPKIGVTIYKYDDNFMSFVRRAITNSAEGKAEVLMNDSQNNQAVQNDQVDMMIAKGVKSLAINLVDPQAATSIIAKAKEADLPVVFFNKEPTLEDLNSYDRTWYVGTASKEAGIIQGEMIAEMWKANPEWDTNGDGVLSYVLLKGEPGHPDAEARTKFAVSSIVDAGIEVEELELQTGMWDSVKAKELTDAWLAKHGDNIEFVIANNDGMALGALQSLKANGYFAGDKFMPLVGVDAIPDVLEQIKAGTIVGTVLNDAANQGRATLELANNVARGNGPLDGTEWELADKAVRVPYVGVTIDNIEFAEKAYQ
ncbi:galactose/glucose ABC transporter substrate-binding protein MglB [Clostridiaceae bacterium HSG29]|nr:galactose/glucose ABC transporter substrate-binding protein MglB [Clostridiaceae bacterium HSG29]